MHSGVHHALAATWKRESARLVAAVARRVRDLGVAEELAQDALVAALEHWPRDGLPNNPAAWLMTTALNRALDHLRRQQTAAAGQAAVARDLEALDAHRVPDVAETVDAARADPIGDDLLRLIFTACHPVLPVDARVALTLRLLGGLTTHEIARAFLVARTDRGAAHRARQDERCAEAGVPFELPPREALARSPRCSVLEVVYLVFNEGYTATARRPLDAPRAVRRGDSPGPQLLAALAPREAEVHGLVALMELQASRAAARTDADGVPVLLADQDRGRWDVAADRARPGRAGACRGSSGAGRALPAAGRHRRLPCARASAQTHRLGPYRRALRCSWYVWPRRRWSSSTARWRWPCIRGRRPGWPSSTRWPTCPNWRATPGCRPCAATF